MVQEAEIAIIGVTELVDISIEIPTDNKGIDDEQVI